MNSLIKGKNSLLIYLLKFGGCFAILYFGTLGIIGLSSPGNYYSSFVANYLDFITPLRSSLLYCAKLFLSVFGYSTYFQNDYTLAIPQGRGVRMVYSCIGYGVMSFWTAFVVANTGNIKKKLLWIVSGLLVLYIINVLRIALLLLAINKQWTIPFGWDHHTWFNVFAYSAIFLMIYIYDRALQPQLEDKSLARGSLKSL